MGKLLRCAKSITELEISSDEFGDSCHGQSSEPFFYDSSYTMVKHATIAVDNNGRCVIAKEIGKRDPNRNRPKWWKCTAECNHMTSKDVKTIMSIKTLFDKPVRVLSEGLRSIDECTEHGHYTRLILLKDEDSDSDNDSRVHTDYDLKPYYELAGHPLLCCGVNSMCQSRLRVLRAVAAHFPQLRKLFYLLYEAIREHQLIDSIDVALHAGDLKTFVNYVVFQTTSI